ncbi:MAG: DNA photolyase FAD-binding protein, partial [Brevundimonas sp.]
SNTLSWRWVAGLQTVGKTYLATADNIARYTDGRFRPQGLARSAEPLVEAEPVGPTRPLPPAARETPAGPHLLLVTPEDLTPEHLIGPWEIAGVALVAGPDAATEGPARTFLDGALADAGARAGARYGAEPVRLTMLDGAALSARARAVGAIGVVTPAAPVGPMATALAAAREELATEGLALVEVRRDWDAALWPLATKGFFPFKEKAPQVLVGLGLPV